MKWKAQTDVKALQGLQGQVLNAVLLEFEETNLKGIYLRIGNQDIKIGVAWETIKLFLPAVQYKVTGKISIGNLKAEIDAFIYDNRADAEEKLKDLLYEFPDFEGQITETQEA